ncbi:hypothetical protein Pla123a_31280 [Posidoniimonas polymericola]|uniref:Uncharacterized protein n=1 Tax=Posidoniimonas polymericola TaxID=2528002 RepID=A0A5C5YLI5_9BACT|nr:hypothetical protein [Posidoniimonas polymericola]TWT75618.1 hypothetical protein Pla123a_31280 [Posidoniimonas polymericola]
MPHLLPIADGLPLAAWGDVIGYLVVIVFVVLRYLLSEMGGEKKPKPARPRPAPQPRPVGPPQDDLRSEVDEFLRRAKGLPPREQEPAPQRSLEPAAEPIIIEPNRPRQGQRSRAAGRQAMPAAGRSEPDPHLGGSVQEHVSQHVGHLAESQLAENAARLGEDLGQTDERLEARLKAKFEHRLGRLKQQEEAPLPEVDPLGNVLDARQLAALLASPEGVRNAVVLNEILKRPIDRW